MRAFIMRRIRPSGHPDCCASSLGLNMFLPDGGILVVDMLQIQPPSSKRGCWFWCIATKDEPEALAQVSAEFWRLFAVPAAF
jgi:hypothetical protein